MIRLDHTHHSTVAVCSCGWRALSDTKRGAWALAAQHERAVHSTTQAQDAYRTAKMRS